MGKKPSGSTNALLWWGLVVVVAGVIAWILWRTSRVEPKSALSPTNANSFNAAKATNLLEWVNTNKPAASLRPSAPARTNVVVPPAASKTNIAVASPVSAAKTNAPPLVTVVSNQAALKKVETPIEEERPVKTVLEAQIALARMAISSGPIDGVAGYQTRTALRAFQKQYEIPESGELDKTTRETLAIAEPVFATYTITPGDLARLSPIPETWLGKSQAQSLDYETILELVAEKHQSTQPLIRSLNPSINWTNVAANTTVKVPNLPKPVREKAAFVRIQLSLKMLEAFDAETNLLAHFPCSIAARVEKRPAGMLHVVTGAENPNYSFDPAVFPESPEAQELGRKLIIPPGPNNPVGAAWISLDKPGYGIHGTPKPEQVGRTESHGCFRLANWNAEHLLKIVWAGMPVYVEP